MRERNEIGPSTSHLGSTVLLNKKKEERMNKEKKEKKKKKENVVKGKGRASTYKFESDIESCNNLKGI